MTRVTIGTRGSRSENTEREWRLSGEVRAASA